MGTRFWSISSKKQRTQIIDGERTIEIIPKYRILLGDIPISAVHSYSILGPTKPPVVLIHGFAQNRYTWECTHRSASAYFASLGFDVWNVELRGHGLSRKEGQIGAETFDDYVTDLKNIARALPDSAFWIGHSLGGATIYGAAATMKPLRCRGVIGLGAVFHFAQGNDFLHLLCKFTTKFSPPILWVNYKFVRGWVETCCPLYMELPMLLALFFRLVVGGQTQ